MIKKLSYVIFKILKLIDNFLKILTKRSFLIWFKDFIEKDSYKTIMLDNEKKEVKFFAPNYLTNWLVDDFHKKEPETIDWIRNFTNKKNKIIFWDIGANIGLYSIYAAKIHSDIEVISFEPSTNNLRILSRNIFINKLQDKIKILQLPLGKEGIKFANLKESQFHEGSSHNSFNNDLDFEGKRIKVTNDYKILGISIKYLLENNILEIPDYIKIDVDGIEHIILEGSGNHLSNKKIKGIQVEINENYKEQYDAIIKFMKENGFKFKFKKRNEKLKIYKTKEFSKTYNYYFFNEKK